MRYVIALSISVALTFFWASAFYYMRQSKYEDSTNTYESWYDYFYVYGWVSFSAATAVGVSHTIGA